MLFARRYFELCNLPSGNSHAANLRGKWNWQPSRQRNQLKKKAKRDNLIIFHFWRGVCSFCDTFITNLGIGGRHDVQFKVIKLCHKRNVEVKNLINFKAFTCVYICCKFNEACLCTYQWNSVTVTPSDCRTHRNAQEGVLAFICWDSTQPRDNLKMDISHTMRVKRNEMRWKIA